MNQLEDTVDFPAPIASRPAGTPGRPEELTPARDTPGGGSDDPTVGRSRDRSGVTGGSVGSQAAAPVGHPAGSNAGAPVSGAAGAAIGAAAEEA